MTRHVAVLEPGSGGAFGVIFPDFPGCISVGKGLRDAQAMAREALALHIAGTIEDGEPLPRPASPVAIRQDPFYRAFRLTFGCAPFGLQRPRRSSA